MPRQALPYLVLEQPGHPSIRLEPGQHQLPDFDLQFDVGADILLVRIHPRTKLELGLLNLYLPISYEQTQSVFCNGFQSWSESREYGLEESIPPLRRIARHYLGNYGDNHLDFVKRGQGHLHSWTYTYLREADAPLRFWASLGEEQGFTCFQHQIQQGVLQVTKDLVGSRVEATTTLLHVWQRENSHLRRLHEQWFDTMSVPAPDHAPATGWTSWYQHYTHISEEIILGNAAAFADHQLPIQYFQTDDGYQTKVGDWLSIKPTFPNGMQYIAEQVKAHGFTPGLWLAPFIAEKDSALLRQHPDWLLRNADGQPVRAGYSPGWSGWFYALDIYQPEFRAYLKEVFDTVVKTWGFGLLKLDFLYAACIVPQRGKSRGQVMYEAMQWLRELSGGVPLLGCGVPLGSAFGLVDYCRIGADIHLRWEHGLLHWLRNRERVSTVLSLRSTLSRWALSGLAFWNDPDVFLLRDENLHLTPTQKQTIQWVNMLCGHLLFTSDDPRQYNAQQLADFCQIFDQATALPTSVTRVAPDVYRIDRGEHPPTWINLSKQAVEVEGQRVEAYGVVVVSR